ncbi:MAG: hypothetical protein ACM36C_13525 [Acidobacteriota bacterium]
MKTTKASAPSLYGSEFDHCKSENRILVAKGIAGLARQGKRRRLGRSDNSEAHGTAIEQTARTGQNMNTSSDDENLLEELLKDPVTARLLPAWRRSIRELQQAEEAARAAGKGPAWDVDTDVSNDDH